MNRSYRFYIMFCSFSLARVFVILRELVNLLTSILIIFTSIHVLFIFFASPKKTEPKEKSPLLRNFSLRAKTVLYVPRRYRSCPSERPAPILNQGIVIRLTLWV